MYEEYKQMTWTKRMLRTLRSQQSSKGVDVANTLYSHSTSCCAIKLSGWKASLRRLVTRTVVAFSVVAGTMVLGTMVAGWSQETLPATGQPAVVVKRERTTPTAKPGQPITPEEIVEKRTPEEIVEKTESFVDDCENWMTQGFWKEAYEGIETFLFEGKRPELKDATLLEMARYSLANLDRADEMDAFLDRVLERYNDDWRGRVAVVTERLQLGTRICRVGETFYRGKWVDGGEWLDSTRRDRTVALKILLETIPITQAEPSPEHAALYQTIAATLRWNTPDWKLQLLTDLDGELPEYSELPSARRGDNRGAPVNENGEPIYYAVPRRFEDAANDGQRWRWCLEQTAEVDATRLGEMRIEWATFLASQFGVQTLGNGFYGRNSDTELPQQTRSAKFQLESLTETETIARLADGVRRFELPQEYNYIAVLRDVSQMERGTVGMAWAQAMRLLGRECSNRRQYSRAVEWYDRILESQEELENRYGDQGTHLVRGVTKERDAILAQRAMVEILSPQKRTSYLGTGPDGKPNPVLFALDFRNATNVTFTATKADLDGAVRDMLKETETIAKTTVSEGMSGEKSEENFDPTKTNALFFELMEWSVTEPRLRSYFSTKPTVVWRETLTPAEDHHDRRIVLDAPIQEPGAYWLTCQPENGLRQCSLLWVDEAVLTRRMVEETEMYCVNRADDGTPIEGASCLFYGVAKVPDKNGKRPALRNEWMFPGTIETKQITKTTDENGTLRVSKEEFPEGFVWIVVVYAPGTEHVIAMGAPSRSRDFMYRMPSPGDHRNNSLDSDIYRATQCYMMTDRPVYRPEQTAHYKFWVRTATYATFNDAEFANRKYTLRITNPKGETVAESVVTTDEYGGVEGEYAIPADAPLGPWSWSVGDVESENVNWSGMLFRIEEYKKPEYEVTVDAPAEPVRLGDVIEAKITAKYYFGSPVTEAKVKYKVTRNATSQSWYPTWRWDWLYGAGSWWFCGDYDWYPGWRSWGGVGRFGRRGGVGGMYGGMYGGIPRFQPMPEEVVLEDEVDIGPDGTVSLKIDTAIARDLFPGTDHRYQISAEVIDQSRRTITGDGAVIAAQKPFAVTVWTDQGYYDTGDTVKVQCAARTADGKPVCGKTKLTLYSVDYTAGDSDTTENPKATENPNAAENSETTENSSTAGDSRIAENSEAAGGTQKAGRGGNAKTEPMEYAAFCSRTLPVRETLVETWEGDTDESGRAAQSIVAAAPGQYRVAYEVTDGKNETITGGYLFSVFAGAQGESATADASKYRFNGIELLPDKREYAPGETVNLCVATGQENGFVQLYVRLSDQNPWGAPRFVKVQGRSTVVPIEVKAGDTPNFYVYAVSVADGQVHEATREIFVPPVSKVIDVTVRPSKDAYRPGERAKVELELRDPDGKPMTGPVVVSIYDKSVEYISGGSSIPDIKDFFWSWRRSAAWTDLWWARRDLYPSQVNLWVGMNRPDYYGPLDGRSEMLRYGDFLRFPFAGTMDFVRSARRKNGAGPGGVSRSMAVGEKADFLMDVDAPMAQLAAAPAMAGGMVGEMVGEMANALPAPPAPDREFGENRSMVAAAQSDALPAQTSSGGTPLVEANVRKSFADTALWAGSLMASNDGTAEVELDMPENLTTWKIRVWGLNHETSCGEGTAEVVTRKDLILRMQTPRFLVQTDEVVLTANVHNYLATEKEVTVSLELAGTPTEPEKSILEWLPDGGERTQVVRIAPNGEAQVNWRVRVLDEGDAVVRMQALTDEESDAMEWTVPCKIHGMLKREAVSGVVAPDAASGTIRLTVPAQRRADQTRLVVNVSPTIAASMIDALPFLIDYPYGCTEQTLNRFLPAAITQKTLLDMGIDLETIRDATANLNTQQLGSAKDRIAKEGEASSDVRLAMRYRRSVSPVFDTAKLRQIVDAGVEKLAETQLSDGGWGWFSGYGERASAHMTATAVRGLMVARRSDVAVDEEGLRRGVAWLIRWQKAQIEELQRGDEVRRLREEGKDDEANLIHDYRMTAEPLEVLVWMVIAEAERDGLVAEPAEENAESAQKNASPAEMSTLMSQYLFRDRPQLPVYAQAMAGIGFDLRGETRQRDVVMRGLNQYLVQDDENQTAYLDLGPNVFWWCWYGSHFEAQAYYLKLLVRVDPKGETTRRMVKYLLNNRRNGTYWNSTRDTALCVEAFAEFLRASGEIDPTTNVTVKLDGEVVKTIEFTPETLFTTDNVYTISGAAIGDGEHTVELVKTGAGPLYYHGYLENFTLEDRITKAGLEVKIDRIYWKLNRVEDASETVAGGRGQVVTIGVEKYTRERIDDLSELKSGELVEVELMVDSKNDYEYLVFVDPKAAGMEAVDLRSGYNGNSLGAYVEFRDDRVCFFVGTLTQGTHTVSYRLRAETPGQFSALPARAEAMYAPELQGNSDEFKVRITE